MLKWLQSVATGSIAFGPALAHFAHPYRFLRFFRLVWGDPVSPKPQRELRSPSALLVVGSPGLPKPSEEFLLSRPVWFRGTPVSKNPTLSQ
eukprot:10899579-Prorocentrum_lima.AAC.1